jgi:hypothetical protein
MRITRWLCLALLLTGCEIDELDPSAQLGEGGAVTGTETASVGGASNGQAGPLGPDGKPLPGAAGAQGAQGAGIAVGGPAAGLIGQAPDGTVYVPPGYQPGSGLLPGDVGTPWTPGGATAPGTMPTPQPTITPRPPYVPVASVRPSTTPVPFPSVVKIPYDPVTYTNSFFLNFVTTQIYGQKPYVQPALSWPLALKEGPLVVKVVTRPVNGRNYAGPHRLELQRVDAAMKPLEKTVLFDWLGGCQRFEVPDGVAMQFADVSHSLEGYNNAGKPWVKGPVGFNVACPESDSPAAVTLQVEITRAGTYRLSSSAKNSIWEIRCQQESLAVYPTPVPAPPR